MSTIITAQQVEAVLESDFNPTVLSRGYECYRQGRILSQEVSGAKVITQIRGQAFSRYRLSMSFSEHRGRLNIQGYCSCPVTYGCKHMVAALYYYIQHLDQRTNALKNRQFKLWLNGLKTIVDNNVSMEQADSEYQLHYVLSEKSNFYDKSKFVVDLRKCKRLINGRWGKGTAIRAINYENYLYEGWIKTLDRQILEVLKQNYFDHALPDNQLGAFVLEKMLETGRCFYKDNKQPALCFAEKKPVQFLWEESDTGSHLQVEFAEHKQSIVIPTEPVYCLNTQSYQISQLEQPLPAPLLIQLLEMPELSQEHQAVFSQFVVEQLPVNSIPTPSHMNIELWQGTPSPVLSLFNNEVGITSGMPMMRLQFEYSPMLLEAELGLTKTQQVVEHNGQHWQLVRDSQLEQACIDALQAMGFSALEMEKASGLESLNFYSPAQSKSQMMATWYYFEQQISELKQQGWKILIEDSYNLSFSQVEELQVEVEEHDNGWFDLGFNINVNGQNVPLLPLVLQWLEQKNPDMPLLIEGENGQWQEVPKKVIQPVLDTLMELYQEPKLNEQGQLLMPRQQAHSLSNLDDDLILQWQGGDKIRALGQKLRDFDGITAVPAPKNLNAQLRDYQQEGLNWLNFLREYGFCGILADDMGLGKTLQTLSFLQHELESGRLKGPSLIVAPTSVLHNWQNEAQRFCPQLSCCIHHGVERKKCAAELKSFSLIVTSYALLQRDADLFKDLSFYALILDEAQSIKNAKAKTAQAAREIPAQFKLCLTGTPMENHLGEMWSLFHFLMPGFLGSEKSFNSLFRNPIEKRGEIAPMNTLSKRIAPFVLRRTKSEVATELPPKTEMIRSVEMGSAQSKLYETVRLAMEKKVTALIQTKGVSRSHIEMLDALLKLRQICCDPQLLKLENAKKVKQSAKLDLLMEMLEELLEEGRKILLFSQFTSMLSLIEAKIKQRKLAYSKLTGQTRKRAEQIERFQSGEVPLFLISLKAGGTGLNLTAADTVIHYDPWWNPAAENQATDRAYRIGQDKPVFVYKLVTENSVEEKILELQKRKQALADDLYGEEQSEPMKKMDAEELLSLFSS